MAKKVEIRVQKWLNSAWKWFRGLKEKPQENKTTSEEFFSIVGPGGDLPDINDLQKDVDIYCRTRNWKQ